MSKRVKAANPFYPVLLVVGVAFALTACAYGVMTVNLLSPAQVIGGERVPGLVAFLDRHGVGLLLGELALLSVVTFATIGTDDYWTRRAEQARGESAPFPADQTRGDP